MSIAGNKGKILYGLGGLAVAVIAWAAFRPELVFVNQKVHESLPVAGIPGSKDAPVILASGKFHGVSHETKGTATIYQLAANKQVLRLADFSTSNGPDVHVYLIAAKDAMDNSTVKSSPFLELGMLKGNQGDQNYDLPATADLTKYRAAVIYCERFHAIFGLAKLDKF